MFAQNESLVHLTAEHKAHFYQLPFRQNYFLLRKIEFVREVYFVNMYQEHGASSICFLFGHMRYEHLHNDILFLIGFQRVHAHSVSSFRNNNVSPSR